VVNNDGLNRPRPDGFGYAVFGKVVRGWRVVDKIKAVKTGFNRGSGCPGDPGGDKIGEGVK
jgi:peptidyl-prolyl cis-trans isomerase A (cyclophilin A)